MNLNLKRMETTQEMSRVTLVLISLALIIVAARFGRDRGIQRQQSATRPEDKAPKAGTP